ncbi:MAG: hypothetical protein ACT4PG_09365 [Panacagrimonas sp.]
MIAIAPLLARLGPLAGRLLMPSLCLAIVAAAAWTVHFDGRKDCESTTQIQQQQDQIEHLQWLGEVADFNAQLAGDYILRRGQAALVYRTLYQEVPHVVTVYKPGPDAPVQPLPACVFTRGFVGVWNRALQADLATTEASPGAAQATTGPSAAEGEDSAALFDAGITQEEILENHLANSEVSTAMRLQCERLIEFHTRGPEAPR